MKKLILAHDLGTSADKAVLFSLEDGILASEIEEYPLYTTGGGEAEQDADDWWRAVCETTKRITEQYDPSAIAAVTFSAQMQGCLCIDRDFRPLRRAMIWADMRAAKEELELAEQISREEYYHITGHRMSCTYGAFKLMWLKKREPEVYRKTWKVLCAKDYAVLKLCGKAATDVSDASGYGLTEIKAGCWSERLITLCGLDIDKLPEIYQSTDIAGYVTKDAAEMTGLQVGTPIVFGAGDGPCAAVGSGCIREGIAYASMGTSSWISIASKTPCYDPKMRIVNWPHAIKGYYMPCGAMQSGGGALAWAAREFCMPEAEEAAMMGCSKYDLINRLAAASPCGSNHLLFLPHLLGERAPYWEDIAKGGFIGLKYAHTRSDMIRAVMEGVAYHLGAILNIYRENGFFPDQLMAIGGGAKSGLWRQIMSSVCDVPIYTSSYADEACSIGAAVTAGVGIGLYSSFDVMDRLIDLSDVIHPRAEEYAVYQKMGKLYLRSYEALRPVFEALR